MICEVCINNLDSKLEAITKLRGFRLCQDDCLSMLIHCLQPVPQRNCQLQHQQTHPNPSLSTNQRNQTRKFIFPQKACNSAAVCNTSKTCSVQQKQKQLHWVYCASGSLSFSLPGLPGIGGFAKLEALEIWKFGNAENEFSFPFAWLKHAQGCLRMLKASRHSALGPQWMVGNSCEWRACIVHSE